MLIAYHYIVLRDDGAEFSDGKTSRTATVTGNASTLRFNFSLIIHKIGMETTPSSGCLRFSVLTPERCIARIPNLVCRFANYYITLGCSGAGVLGLECGICTHMVGRSRVQLCEHNGWTFAF